MEAIAGIVRIADVCQAISSVPGNFFAVIYRVLARHIIARRCAKSVFRYRVKRWVTDAKTWNTPRQGFNG